VNSDELKRLRQKYYNLLDDLNYTIKKLSNVPKELETAENNLKLSFVIDEEPIDNKKLLIESNKIEKNISKLANHVSKIEKIINKLTRMIAEAELKEETS
jgi:hypothetical protein